MEHRCLAAPKLHRSSSSSDHHHFSLWTTLSKPGAMEPHLLDPTSLCWSSSIPLTYTTRSLNVLKETKPTSNPPFLFVRAGKRSSGSSQNGLQRQPKKDLSRILRTEAAISGIERKANSRKYSTLWPKAVLEALDEAIRENRYESALKVCGFFLLWLLSFFLAFGYALQFCCDLLVDEKTSGKERYEASPLSKFRLQIPHDLQIEFATYTFVVIAAMKDKNEGDSLNHSHRLLRHHLIHPPVKNNSYTLVHTLPM